MKMASWFVWKWLRSRRRRETTSPFGKWNHYEATKRLLRSARLLRSKPHRTDDRLHLNDSVGSAWQYDSLYLYGPGRSKGDARKRICSRSPYNRCGDEWNATRGSEVQRWRGNGYSHSFGWCRY